MKFSPDYVIGVRLRWMMKKIGYERCWECDSWRRNLVTLMSVIWILNIRKWSRQLMVSPDHYSSFERDRTRGSGDRSSLYSYAQESSIVLQELESRGKGWKAPFRIRSETRITTLNTSLKCSISDMPGSKKAYNFSLFFSGGYLNFFFF